MYTRSPPTAGIFLEICQFSQNLLANGNQFVQPGAQISKVGRVDLAVFVSAFGDLIQIVTAILKQISHSPQLWKVEVQAVAIQCHFADIGTQTVDAHSIHTAHGQPHCADALAN